MALFASLLSAFYLPSRLSAEVSNLVQTNNNLVKQNTNLVEQIKISIAQAAIATNEATPEPIVDLDLAVKDYLGMGSGHKKVRATLTISNSGANEIAITAVTFRAFVGMYAFPGGVDAGGPSDWASIRGHREIDSADKRTRAVFAPILTPNASAHAGADWVEWHPLNDEGWKFPEPTGCYNVAYGGDASQPVPNNKCNLNGVGRYRKSEKATASMEWHVVIQDDATFGVLTNVDWQTEARRGPNPPAQSVNTALMCGIKARTRCHIQ